MPGRMSPSWFCWNHHMASSLLMLHLAPVQPVLRFLSAMLKPGLPSTTWKSIDTNAWVMFDPQIDVFLENPKAKD